MREIEITKHPFDLNVLNNNKRFLILKSYGLVPLSILMRCCRIQTHPYHLVKPSAYPLMCSIGAFGLVRSLVSHFHETTCIKWWREHSDLLAENQWSSFWSFVLQGHICEYWWIPLFIFGLIGWFSDIIKEATFERQHTLKVNKGLRMGFVLFIVSEVFFFFSFFRAFFHGSVTVTTDIGNLWPVKGILVLDAVSLPILNSYILLASGGCVTAAHHFILKGSKNTAMFFLLIGIILGLIFTACQYYEYLNSPFSVQDGVFGSVSFVATGFHGLHVLIGSIFLGVCLWRLYADHFTEKAGMSGFEAAAWYWHFVDVIWLYLFVVIYCWGI